MTPDTVNKWLFYGKNILKDIGIDSYSIDAEILLMKVLNFTKVQLFTKDDYVLTKDEVIEYTTLLNKRKDFMPVQYITGKCEFMGIDFNVNQSTLIPRGDTEILVEAVINEINKKCYKTVLDIGTGSGSIAVSIAKYCEGIKVTASDISVDALKIAGENAANNSVSDRTAFILSDVYENINSKFDVIVSNPPYIKTDVIKTLMPNVKNYEPLSALDGGRDGLYFYRKIINGCKEHLNKDGALFFEIGYDQAEEVSNLLKNENFSCIKIEKDLAGFDRVVSCEYKYT